MHVGNIDMLDEVLVTCRTALHSDSASVLKTVFGERCPLDISEMRDSDHHILVSIEVLRIELLCRKSDFRPAGIAVFLLHLESLVLDDLHLHALVRKHILAVADELHELVILVLELLPLESCELAETHLDDCSSLHIGEAECSHELVLRLFHALRRTDDIDDLVDHIKSLEETFEDMGSLARLLEVELCPSHDNLMTMSDEVLDQLLKVEGTRSAVHEGDIVHREARLKRRILVKHVEHHIRIRILLEADHDTHSLHCGLVVDVCDSVNLLCLDKLCDLLDHLTLVDHVRNLGNDDGLTAGLAYLDISLRTDHDTSAACLECILDALTSLDDASCREIRTLDILHEFLDGDLRIVDVCADSVTALGKVVRRHVCRHTYRDTRRTVQEKERKLGRKDRRLLERVVEVVLEINGILVEVSKNLV